MDAGAERKPNDPFRQPRDDGRDRRRQNWLLRRLRDGCGQFWRRGRIGQMKDGDIGADREFDDQFPVVGGVIVVLHQALADLAGGDADDRI